MEQVDIDIVATKGCKKVHGISAQLQQYRSKWPLTLGTKGEAYS